MDSKYTERGVLPGKRRDWNAQVEQLLADWRQRVFAAHTAHYASADRFRLLNYFVGIPAVIFSSVVGTTIFAGLEKNSPKAPLVALASILAAALARATRGALGEF